MNKIEKLIKKLCPDGVELMELGNFINYEQPTKYIVTSTNYEDKFSTPVLTAGQTFILGYTNEEFGILNASKNNPVIIFDDFTTSFHWVDFSFKVKSSAMKILTSVINEKINFRYIYYAMKCIDYKPVDHARQWISIYSKFQIPVPPLIIQEKIVEILEQFTQLHTELETELEARKAQYQFYRNQLLAFENKEVDWKFLEEVCKNINAGGDLPKNLKKDQDTASKEFPYPIFANAVEKNGLYGFTDCYKIESDSVTIAARGAKIGFHVVREGKYTPIVRLISLIPNKNFITTRFLNYVLDITEIAGTKGGIPQLTVPTVKRIRIPVPPLAEQERIVKILDQFDDLVNNISSGLPAEIKARRQQYEYYRAKLLTFKVMEIN